MAHAANGIALDNADSSFVTGGSLSFSFTVNSGTDRFMLIGIGWIALADDVLSVEYNDVAATEITQLVVNDGFGQPQGVALWGLIAPDTGTHNMEVALNAGTTNLSVGASCWTGVHQTAPYGTPNSASGTGTAASVTISSAIGEVVVDSHQRLHFGRGRFRPDRTL